MLNNIFILTISNNILFFICTIDTVVSAKINKETRLPRVALWSRVNARHTLLITLWVTNSLPLHHSLYGLTV